MSVQGENCLHASNRALTLSHQEISLNEPAFASMIVSESHHFVFVHIFKTGGTSVKRALRRFAMRPWQEPANAILKRIGIPQFGPRGYRDHMTASQLIDDRSLDWFQSQFSFAFVRNPWDWELSHYKYILRNNQHFNHKEVSGLNDFSEYVRWRCDRRTQLQSDFVMHQGKLVVDFVGRFENLDADFRHVCDRIDVRCRLKKLNSTRKSVYQQHYDDRTRELIGQTCKRDIEIFGYQFDGNPAPHEASSTESGIPAIVRKAS